MIERASSSPAVRVSKFLSFVIQHRVVEFTSGHEAVLANSFRRTGLTSDSRTSRRQASLLPSKCSIIGGIQS